MSYEENVYIGRQGIVFVKDDSGAKCRWPKEASKWCNSYKVNNAMSLNKSLRLYRTHLTELLEDVNNMEEFKLL